MDIYIYLYIYIYIYIYIYNIYIIVYFYISNYRTAMTHPDESLVTKLQLKKGIHE